MTIDVISVPCTSAGPNRVIANLSMLRAAALTLMFALCARAGAAQETHPVEIPEIQWLAMTEVIPSYTNVAAYRGPLNRWAEKPRASTQRLSAYLEGESYRASAKSEAELHAAAQAVHRLADRIGSDARPGVRELDQAIAQAQRAVAAHYLELARRFAVNAPARSGRYLDSSARSIESASFRVGYEIGDAERATLREAHAAAREIAAGQEWAGAAAADLLERVHTAIKSIRSRSASSSVE